MRVAARSMYRSRLVSCAAATFLAVLAASVCSFAGAQTTAPDEWTWMGGSNTQDQPGVYGMLGTPASVNSPGGREGSATWTDKQGNFWLFGGFGYDGYGAFGYLNDLWLFSLSQNTWAWMGGSNTVGNAGGQPGTYGTLGASAAGNVPGGREDASTWIDSSGNFWLFGGWGYDGNGVQGWLNDLWQFDPSTGKWTWKSGSSSLASCPSAGWCSPSGVYGTLGVPNSANVPAGRYGAAAWTDANDNLWLFGGTGSLASTGIFFYLNDLWKYAPSEGTWTWMGGCDLNVSDGCDVPGTYGILGVPSAGNSPGARELPSVWPDRSGNIWLFGGYGAAVAGPDDELDDLWKFNLSTTQWTWEGGSSLPGQPGTYGTLRTPSIANIPGGRHAAATWTDADGNMWLFGGPGYDSAGTESYQNDLWEFSPSSGEWTWMGGSETVPGFASCHSGVYGILGASGVDNIPGGRGGTRVWVDAAGKFWLLGGLGCDDAHTYFDFAKPELNDLWTYTPAAPTAEPSFAVRAFAPAGVVYATPGATVSLPIEVLAAGGFNSQVTLSAMGLLSGESFSFSPDSITGAGWTEMTVTAPLTGLGPGNESVITISATSGGQVVAANFDLMTVTDGTFSLAASPDSLSVNQGGSGTTTLTVTPQSNLTGTAVNFTCWGLPSGATCSFNPSKVTLSGNNAATTQITISPGPSTPTGSYNVIISGVSGYLTESSTIGLTIAPPLPPTFTLQASPTSLAVNSGSQGSTTLTVTPQNGFNSTVSFACTGLPSNAACSFSPTTVTPSGAAATTQLTIAVGAQASVAQPRSRPFLPTTGLAIAACFFIRRRRRLLGGALVVMLLLVGAGLLSGCGGGGTAGGGGGGGSPQSYTVTVTATSGTIQQTTAVTLTENSERS